MHNFLCIRKCVCMRVCLCVRVCVYLYHQMCVLCAALFFPFYYHNYFLFFYYWFCCCFCLVVALFVCHSHTLSVWFFWHIITVFSTNVNDVCTMYEMLHNQIFASLLSNILKCCFCTEFSSFFFVVVLVSQFNTIPKFSSLYYFLCIKCDFIIFWFMIFHAPLRWSFHH